MSELQVCEQCQRHIRVNETACPFCQASKRPVSGRGVLRSAIVAGAITGASAMGCGDSKPAVEGPQPDEHQVQAVESDAQEAAPAESDAMVADSVELPVELPPPMPYGAPPARRRLV